MPPRILSISYDATLLNVRRQLLEREGYEVVSAEGYVQALKYCNEGRYDLVILGHSIPPDDKQALFEVISRECPVPVVSVRRPGEPDFAGATAVADPFDPEQFIETVRSVLARKSKAGA
jgi:DNA-binding response OmpR family regulator